ncbi:bacteriocin [Flavobacterium amniphilum]|uniref:bacteriocin n=1 Tax=Flavobacterium amniphilum TaxID=1834035 RepID=UPI002029B870|nr:bacteriocin [Flavobacterium amniphilum]MCL9805751.1 bacteriocin [Flavobacterium amniphilum]MCL9806338.1 bacteriocin [Flavobacterium amniphilum]
MLKNKLRDLNKGGKSESKSIEIINDKDLQNIKGGKLGVCPKLTKCETNYDDCPILETCGSNHTTG